MPVRARCGSEGLGGVLRVVTLAIELGGGLLLLLGWQARWAALAISLWLIPVTFLFHNYWAVDAAQMRNQFNHFYKNLCIMGGMLYVFAYGSGAFSLGNNGASRAAPSSG